MLNINMRFEPYRVVSALSANDIQHIFIPAETEVLGQRRICIVLHGKGDRPQSFAGVHDELRLYDFDFLCLEGWLTWEDGYRWMLDEPKHKSTLMASVMLLADVVQVLLDQGYRTQDIYFMGHSQGGRVLFHYLLHVDVVFGGAVFVSSYFPDRLWNPASQFTPMLITHGSRDKVIAPSEVRADLAELVRLALPFEYFEFLTKTHDFDLRSEMPMIGRWLRGFKQFRIRNLKYKTSLAIERDKNVDQKRNRPRRNSRVTRIMRRTYERQVD